MPASIAIYNTLVDVGLGYVRLRPAPAPTLSSEVAGQAGLRLQKRSTGRTVYILDRRRDCTSTTYASCST